MADNSNSFTYKMYKRNKRILKFVYFVLVAYALWLAIYSYFVLQNKSVTPIGLIIVLFAIYISFTFYKRWMRQNNKYIRENYNTWGKGAGAELSVMKALEGLPPEYR